MVKFEDAGKENGKSSFSVKRRISDNWIDAGSIFFQNEDWILLHKTGRIDRFETLAEARSEAAKI